MLARFFRHIRKQPKQVKNNYAFGVASGFTGLVALVWLFGSFGQGIQSIQTKDIVADNQGSSPFASLIEQSKSHLANIKSSFKSAVPDANNPDGENTSGSENTGAGEVKTASDPREIKLSPEDIDIAKKKAEQIDGSYDVFGGSATTTVNDSKSSTTPQNTNQSSKKPTNYEEIQVISSSEVETRESAGAVD